MSLQVGVQGLEIFKPHTRKESPSSMLITNGIKQPTDTVGGAGFEVHLVLCEENFDDEMTNWKVENVKFSVQQPVIGL